MLSGYCFDYKKYTAKGFVINKIKTILIPYAIFALILFFVWNIMLFILGRTEDIRPITELMYSLFWINTEAKTFGVVQWFLTCLFITEMIFYFIIKAVRGNKTITTIIIIVFSIIGYSLPSVLFNRLPWGIDCAVTAVTFYGIGWLLRNVDTESIKRESQNNPLFVIAILLWTGALLTCSIFNNGYVNMRNIYYGEYGMFF